MIRLIIIPIIMFGFIITLFVFWTVCKELHTLGPVCIIQGIIISRSYTLTGTIHTGSDLGIALDLDCTVTTALRFCR